MLPYRNCAVAKEAPQSSYADGATNLSWETISALLNEKASGIAIAIISLSLRSVLELQSVVVVSYASFFTHTQLSKMTASYRQILLVKKRLLLIGKSR